MAKVLDRPSTSADSRRAELLRRYREVCDLLPDSRVEIIDGRIVVREVPTIDHARIILQLLRQILAFATTQGWSPLWDLKLFLGAQMDRYKPDLIVLPAKPRMWDAENVYAADTLLVVEVVSDSSKMDDHLVKPKNCALAGVPLYLVIDTFEQRVRLLSQPGETGYDCESAVAIGKPLELPEPWGLTIDTGALVEP